MVIDCQKTTKMRLTFATKCVLYFSTNVLYFLDLNDLRALLCERLR